MPHPSRLAVSLLVLFLSWVAAVPVRAELVKLEITQRLPYAEGRSFEGIGPYQILRGKGTFAVDPKAEANKGIVDVDLAPRNADGRVEFTADVELLAPVDLSKANGTLLYEVNNRGNRKVLTSFNDGADHFLMRRGYIVAWSGWSAEVLPNENFEFLGLELPVARQEGQEITGPIWADIVVDKPCARANITNRAQLGCYEPTERGRREGTLTWRLRKTDPRVVIPRTQWHLETSWIEVGGRKSKLPAVELVVNEGLQPGYIYELIYEGRNPVVQGLGLAGIRDLVSFLRHDTSAQNPLRVSDQATAVQRTLGWGSSQSGRCLRVITYEGLNADEKGRRVFDGIMPMVASGLGYFNNRFAQTSRFNSQHRDHYFPVETFPFTYGEEQDPYTKRTDSVLTKARSQGVVPKVMHVQTAAEYWHLAGSLVHTDPLGTRDSVIPPEVRIYSIGGAQHGPGEELTSVMGVSGKPENPTDYRCTMRALLVALDRWVQDGTEPPASRYPRIDNGTLVDWPQSSSGWQTMPGLRYPEVIQQPELYDYGPTYSSPARALGEAAPAKSLGAYRVRVPGYGPDNNDRGMLMLPTLTAPVATYTGWALRSRESGAENELVELKGMILPFSRTAEERRASGDPRPALLERYRDFDDYVSQVEKAARELVNDRILLEEDVPLFLERARARKSWFETGPEIKIVKPAS